MGGVDLVIFACLVASPIDCAQMRSPFAGSIIECAKFGQPSVATWNVAHPEWRVTRWRCGPHGVEI